MRLGVWLWPYCTFFDNPQNLAIKASEFWRRFFVSGIVDNFITSFVLRWKLDVISRIDFLEIDESTKSVSFFVVRSILHHSGPLSPARTMMSLLLLKFLSDGSFSWEASLRRRVPLWRILDVALGIFSAISTSSCWIADSTLQWYPQLLLMLQWNFFNSQTPSFLRWGLPYKFTTMRFWLQLGSAIEFFQMPFLFSVVSCNVFPISLVVRPIISQSSLDMLLLINKLWNTG